MNQSDRDSLEYKVTKDFYERNETLLLAFEAFAYMQILDVCGDYPEIFLRLRDEFRNDALIDLFVKKEFSHA